MSQNTFDRRTVLTATTALGAASLLPRQALAQTGGGPASLPARGEFVVRGAHVLSMDDKIGDLPSGDVHVRDGAIVAVAANVNAPGPQVIDGKGMICMPGFVDTHWHHWTTFLRPVMRADNPKRTYFPVTVALGRHYTPEDSYRSVRLGLAEALSAGVTTTHNWAHNVRSPAHADAEVKAMRDSGLRGRFAYGPALGTPNDKPMDLADMARLKRDIGNDPCSRSASARAISTATTGRAARSTKRWRRRNGTARASSACRSRCTHQGSASIQILDEAGLLGTDIQLVHPLKRRKGLRGPGQDRNALQHIAARRSRPHRPNAILELMQPACS